MNLEVDTPNDFSNCRQSSTGNAEDSCGSQPSILYLLQEAMQIVTPVTKLDAGGLKHESKENVVRCNQECFISQNTNSYKQGELETPSSFKGTISVKSSSPWEVMSLINIQCEKLLHSKQLNGEEGFSQTDDPIKMDDKVDHMETPYGCGEVDTFRQGRQSDVCWSLAHLIDGTDYLTTQTTSDCVEVKVEDLAALISNNMEDVDSVSVLANEGQDKCHSVDTPDLPLVLKEELCKADSRAEKEEINNVSEISSIDFTSSLVSGMDGDSGISFSFDCETVTMRPIPQPINTAHSKTDINNNLVEEKLYFADDQYKLNTSRRTLRKQAHPKRSADLQDSDVHGVKFSIHSELDHNMDKCRLHITSNYG